ncbi:MAG: NADH-quinone oxidoreductase subunit F [Chloroflexi bacterium]|nr:MAG: NADH-quinone oxidoreductase subunit F [Chloroflexota bacterium]
MTSPETSQAASTPAEAYRLLRAQADAAYAAWERPQQPRIDIAEDTSALAGGAGRTRIALEQRVAARGAAVEVGRVHGYGMQWLQPLADITWPDGTRVLYGPVTVDDIDTLIDEATGARGAAARLAIGMLAGERDGIPPIAAHPFLRGETGGRRLLARIGRTDPGSLDHYIATDGYFPVARMLDRHMDPQAVRQTVIDAGLTGRGGAAFPTGVKWNFLAGAPAPERYLICNADEGDPGAWVNRVLLEGDPHTVIEGMVIAAFATGAQHGFIYIRNEYPLAVQRVREAIADAERAGLLGANILGTSFGCTLEVVQGAGAYVCGEETGLIASVQDGRGMPRIKPPFPANAGVFMKPSNVNNVESYASVPMIMLRGPEWFRTAGTANDLGTKIWSLSGSIPYTGFMEVPFGTALKTVFEACGGSTALAPLKAVQAGGPLAGYLPGRLVESLVLERGSFTQHGALMGGGGIVFVGTEACSVDLNVLFAEFVEDESCGRCTTCHHGNQRMHEIFARITRGGGRVEDRANLERVGGSLQYSNCVHGQASPTIMRNTLRYFEGEYNEHIAGRCDALRCGGLTRFVVTDQSDPRLAEAQEICPTGAISGPDGARVIDDPACIRCGACTDLAPRAISRRAAPVGTPHPRSLPPRPPGSPAAHGPAPLTFQGVGYSRAEGGMGGAPPLRR